MYCLNYISREKRRKGQRVCWKETGPKHWCFTIFQFSETEDPALHSGPGKETPHHCISWASTIAAGMSIFSSLCTSLPSLGKGPCLLQTGRAPHSSQVAPGQRCWVSGWQSPPCPVQRVYNSCSCTSEWDGQVLPEEKLLGAVDFISKNLKYSAAAGACKTLSNPISFLGHFWQRQRMTMYSSVACHGKQT